MIWVVRRSIPRVPLPAELRDRPFSATEARGSGLGAGRLRGPDLATPYPGVRISVDAVVDLRARCAAYSLRMPSTGFFCSLTAAGLYGAPLPPWVPAATIHIGVVAPARAPRVVGVVGHKFRVDPDELVEIDGLRVTRPARTWCDLAAVLSIGDLVAAGDTLAARSGGVTTLDALVDAVGRHPGRRGRATLVEALTLLDPAAESAPESRLRVVLVRGGISGFVVNATIRVGASVFRGDIVFDRERVIVEYDGDYHRDRDQWRRDMTRQSRLEAAGWRVIRVNADDLRTPGELVARIRAVLASRRAF